LTFPKDDAAQRRCEAARKERDVRGLSHGSARGDDGRYEELRHSGVLGNDEFAKVIISGASTPFFNYTRPHLRNI
jgi:hypothetical protein